MKKRLLTTCMILVLGATALPMMASCTKEVIPDFVMPEEGFDTKKEIKITFAHTMGQNLQSVLDTYLGDFKKMYPNITVEHKAIGGYDDVRDQLTTALSAGASEADIAYCYPDHVALYNQGLKVVTLDSLINSEVKIHDNLNNTDDICGMTEEQQKDFLPAYWDEGKAFGDNKMYTLPLSKSSEVLYYDKTFFDNNNLKVPTTWDEMEDVCKKIIQIPGCEKDIPLGYDSESNLFITLCEQHGSPYTSAEEGNHYLFNNDTNKAFVRRLKDWYQKGYITTKELYGSYTSGLFTAEKTQSSAKRSYMCVGSSAGATYQLPDNGRFEVGITSIPQVDVKNHPAVISQGPSLCLFRNKDPQKVLASWLLMKFLTTNKYFQAEFSIASGYTPVLESVFDMPQYNTWLESANGKTNAIAALSVKACVAQKDMYFYSPAFVGSSKARDEVGYLIAAVLKGKDVDAAFQQAIDECVYFSE